MLTYGAWDEPMMALELWFSIQIQITCRYVPLLACVPHGWLADPIADGGPGEATAPGLEHPAATSSPQAPSTPAANRMLTAITFRALPPRPAMSALNPAPRRRVSHMPDVAELIKTSPLPQDNFNSS